MGIDPGMAGIMRQARLLPRTLGAQGQRQASFLGGIFGSGEKKAGIATEATFDYHPYKLLQLDEGPATTTTITRDEALRIYREMVPLGEWRLRRPTCTRRRPSEGSVTSALARKPSTQA